MPQRLQAQRWAVWVSPSRSSTAIVSSCTTGSRARASSPFLPPHHPEREREEDEGGRHGRENRGPIVKKAQGPEQPVHRVEGEAEHDAGEDARAHAALSLLEIRK